MRTFGSDITIDGKGEPGHHGPQQYEHQVANILDRIHHTRTGKAVFTEMAKRTHKKMRIVPLDGVFNAYASANQNQDATLKGHAERSGADGHLLRDSHGHLIYGDGKGSDTVIKFTPSTWVNYCKTGKKGHKSGAHPDEVLFHEMIHAMREMRGVFEPRPLGHLYDTEEEFYAILISNIYASETGRGVDLRSDHHGFDHLAPTQDTSAKFLPKRDPNDYRYSLIIKLVHEEHGLANALAAVHAPFNPVRRYFELQHAHHHAPHHAPHHGVHH